MVFRDALRSGFQFVVTTKNVLSFSIRMGLRFPEKFDEGRRRDDISETLRVSLNIKPNCCKFVAMRAPTSSSYKTIVAGLDYKIGILVNGGHRNAPKLILELEANKCCIK